MRAQYRSETVALWNWLLPALEKVGSRHGPESEYHKLDDIEAFDSPFQHLDDLSLKLLDSFEDTSVEKSRNPAREELLLSTTNTDFAAISAHDVSVTNFSRHVGRVNKMNSGNGIVYTEEDHKLSKEGSTHFTLREINFSNITSLPYSSLIGLVIICGGLLVLINISLLVSIYCRKNKQKKHCRQPENIGKVRQQSQCCYSNCFCSTHRSTTTSSFTTRNNHSICMPKTSRQEAYQQQQQSASKYNQPQIYQRNLPSQICHSSLLDSPTEAIVTTGLKLPIQNMKTNDTPISMKINSEMHWENKLIKQDRSQESKTEGNYLIRDIAEQHSSTEKNVINCESLQENISFTNQQQNFAPECDQVNSRSNLVEENKDGTFSQPLATMYILPSPDRF